MSSKRGHFKDRILEGIAKAIKEVQSFSCSVDGEILTVTNDDRSLQKLVERLDHAFLHGLKNVTRGYWGVAKLFAHRGIIDEISKLDRLTTDLGRSRAWLYKSLNDTSMESYLRCFLENPNIIRKYYVETGMLRDKQRLIVLQTLISGLDFVTFDLELNIAYFDLVSYIPRSASISEHDDEASTPSNDNLPTTPSTPVTNPDTDGNSSIASSEAFSPMDESPQGGIKLPELALGDKLRKIEKRHSLPQHYSEIDLSDLTLAGSNIQKDHKEEEKEGRNAYQRSYSVGKISEGKPVRPVSLGVASRNESKFIGADSSPRGLLMKSVDEDQQHGDLEVIRVKTKKTKKVSKKKRKNDRLSIDGDSQSRICGTSSSVCDDNEASSHVDGHAGETLSICSSSSLQSFSDRTSLNEASNLGKSDAESLSGVSCNVNVDEDTNKNIEVGKGEDIKSDLQKFTQEIGEKTATLSIEETDGQGGNTSQQQNLPEENSREEINQSPKNSDLPRSPNNIINQPASQNLAKNQPEIEHPDTKQHQCLMARSSLDFDETVQLTLTSPKPIKLIQPQSAHIKSPLLTKLMLSEEEECIHQSQYEELNSSLSQSMLSEEAPSFASLFTKSSSQAPWTTMDHPPQSSPGSSSMSTSDISANYSEEGSKETSGCHGRLMRTSSDTSSFKESVEFNEKSSEVTRETVVKEVSKDVDSETHGAEIIVDNNLKLYLMLEIFKNEQEQFKKLIRMSTGHMEGDLQPAFILLTDYMLYILRRGEKQGHYSTQQRLPYSSLDFISVGLNYQTVQIVCTNRRRQYWLTTGDESLTRFFLSSLRQIIEESKQTKEPVSILTDATAQLITLKKWASQECKTAIHDIKLQLYSLVHWEDLTDLSMTPDLQLYEPQVTRKGFLQYKVSSSFPGWESLEEGMVYLEE